MVDQRKWKAVGILELVLVPLSCEQFLSRKYMSSGSNENAIVMELKAAVLVYVSRLVGGGIEGIDFDNLSPFPSGDVCVGCTSKKMQNSDNFFKKKI